MSLQVAICADSLEDAQSPVKSSHVFPVEAPYSSCIFLVGKCPLSAESLELTHFEGQWASA